MRTTLFLEGDTSTLITYDRDGDPHPFNLTLLDAHGGSVSAYLDVEAVQELLTLLSCTFVRCHEDKHRAQVFDSVCEVCGFDPDALADTDLGPSSVEAEEGGEG